MSIAGGKNEREIANAAHELFLLGQKTVEARAVLAALQKQLSDASSRLVDTQQVEQVIEANQQLVLAILLAQSDAAAPLTWRSRVCFKSCARLTRSWS